MVSLPLCHIDGKRQEKEWYVPNPAIYIRTLVHIFIPFGLHSSRTLNPGRPMMIWSAIKLPDGLRSFTGLRICGTSSVCCGDTFRTPSASGLTSCPSFSFSATSGVHATIRYLFHALHAVHKVNAIRLYHIASVFGSTICRALIQVQRSVRVFRISHSQSVFFSTCLKLTAPSLGP